MPAGLDGNPDPLRTAARDRVLDSVAAGVLADRPRDRPLLVAIDGVDGAGKSTFADELAGRLDTAPVVRSTIDWFHRPRRLRLEKGRRSAIGFYADSHDLDRLRSRLLDPFRAGAGAEYRVAAFDEPSDRPLDPPPAVVAGGEILLFDGIFLCRPELVGYWDHIVFLDGRERVNLGRLGLVEADVDDSMTAVETTAAVLEWVERIERYAGGMSIYLDTDDPMARADVVIDNNDLANPVIMSRSP